MLYENISPKYLMVLIPRISEALWAMMVVNTVAMIGLFVWEYFNSKYLVEVALEDELPIDLSEIPF